MMLALITAPVICARLLSFRLKKIMMIACLISILSSLFGVALSRHLLSVYSLAISTGGLVVCILFLAVLLLLLLSLKKRAIQRLAS